MIDDLRYAFRSLRRAPLFTLSAVLALALGIGANSAVFSVVYSVLLKPLPYPDPDRVVRVYETNHAHGIVRGDVSPGTFVDARGRTRTLEHLALYMPREWLLAFGDDYEEILGARVSPALFDVLGVPPVLGRTFRAEAQQAAPFGDSDEVVIGYNLWRRRYGGRPTVLGETIRVEGRTSRRIVGVMPPGFDFPGGTEVWGQETFLRPVGVRQRETRYYQAIGRLRPGITIEAARAELADVSAELAREHPGSNAGFSMDFERLDAALTSGLRPALLLLLGVVFCVLLIACSNVANLMVARAAVRRHEMAVRSALGAGLGRLLRQTFTESVLLSTAGLTAGVMIALWGTRVLTTAAPGGIPRLDEAGLGSEVLAFTGGIALLAAVITGIVPALQTRALDVHEALKTSGRSISAGGGRTRGWIIAAEVALTLVLVISATVMLRSFVRLRAVDVGFTPAGVLTADLRLPTNRFADTRRPWFRLALEYDRILAEIRALPGVDSVGGITGMPLTGEGATGRFWMDGGAASRPDATAQWTVGINIVTPDYFTAMRIPVIRGRSFGTSDRLSESALTDPQAPQPRGVVIINEAMARRFWPGQDPVGRAIRLADHWAVEGSTIIGIARDVRADAIAAAPEPAVFVPWGEIPGYRLALAIRTRGDLEPLAGALRSRLRELDSHLLVADVQPLDAVVANAVSRPRFNLLLVACFAALALVLASVGIYGVVAYLAARRTREMGIRIALGARRRHVLRLVFRDGMRPVFLGLAAGVIPAFAAVRAMRGLLFEIEPADPISFVIAALLLLATAAAAALIPARRATRVDPLVALRDE
jgi:putative ABC transport system permease protein